MGKPVKFTDRNKPWNQRSLKRKTKVRPEREYILIVCEGERTEPGYFEAIRQSLPPHVAVVVKGQGMNTISLVREAIRLRDERQGNDIPYDQTWAVFDRDDFPAADFDNAITMCEQKGLKAAYSNQAFELWYILHFEERQTGMHRDQYKQCLTKHLGESYRKNDAAMYNKLQGKGSETDAIRRAKSLLQAASHPPSSSNPCTTVYTLVEELNRFRLVGDE